MADDDEKRGPLFFAYGPYDLLRHPENDTFDYKKFKQVAEEQDEWSDEPGCYIICQISRSKLTARYIGKSEGPLLKRIYQHREMIGRVLNSARPGIRLQIIMLHYYKGRGKLNSTAVNSLETELIQIAMRNGIKLDNIQKARSAKVCIAGVQNGERGERSPAAKPLMQALGMRSK